MGTFSVYNVKDAPYNAVGNGVADDTGAIQSAINAAASAKGVVYFTNNRRMFFGTAAPTSGTWNRGDIVYQQNPSAGQYIGWVCVFGDSDAGQNAYKEDS